MHLELRKLTSAVQHGLKALQLILPVLISELHVCMLMQGIFASFCVPATRCSVLIVATAVTLTMERTSVHVMLATPAQVVSLSTGVLLTGSRALTTAPVCCIVPAVTTRATVCRAILV